MAITIPKIDTSQLEELRKQYTSHLTPTAGETEAQTQLQNIITSKELGIAKAEQEPMAQKFVTGQSTALEKSAALKSMPLQTRLASLQSQRQAAADVLKSQLGFEEANISRQTSERNLQLQYQEKEDDRRYQEEQLAKERAYLEGQQEKEYKQQLKSLAMQLGVSTKTKKGGTLSTKNLEKAISKANSRALEEVKKSSDLDYKLKLKELNKPYYKPETNDTDKRDKEFEAYVMELVQNVGSGEGDRERAKNLLKTYYPDYDENIIYSLIPD